MGYWTRPFDNHVQRACDSPGLIESVWRRHGRLTSDIQ